MLQNAKKELLHWIKEREEVRKRKESNTLKPWTTDPIIRDYKFCNVNREDDKVTRWVHFNWLHPNSDSPNIAFAMCVARHFNWPDTLELMGYPHEWHPEKMRGRLKSRREAGHKIYTGAYMISTNGVSMDKIDYSIDRVLSPLWGVIRNPRPDETLESYVKYLMQFNGFSSFLAGQVVADLKWVLPLEAAPDWNTWTPLGPGSIRGLNRLFDRKLGYNVPAAQGVRELLLIQSIIQSELGMTVALHNVQNCMCEFDKYMRLKHDGGKVRSKYPGRA